MGKPTTLHPTKEPKLANLDHVNKLNTLNKGQWREWRRENPDLVPDLSMLDHDARRNESGYPESPRDLACYDLSRADLRGGNLSHADLSHADLSHACLTDAILVGALLEMTKLENTSLWSTHLFEPPQRSESSDLPLASISSVQDLQTRFDDDLNRSRSPNFTIDWRLYFRGEKNQRYGDEPKKGMKPLVMRKTRHMYTENDMMNELSIRRPGEIDRNLPYFQRMVIAQHYGLPTRLLDITRNPLVALFYASETNKSKNSGILHHFAIPTDHVYPYDSDTVSLVANFCRLGPDEKDALLTKPDRRKPRVQRNQRSNLDVYDRALTRLNHFISQEKPRWKDRIEMRDLFKVMVVEPQRSFERLRANSGAFMLSAFHERFEQWEVHNRINGAAPYVHRRFEVPHCAKKDIRDQLEAIGITEEFLKADLQSAAKAIAREA